jgi:hypothetical protein
MLLSWIELKSYQELEFWIRQKWCVLCRLIGLENINLNVSREQILKTSDDIHSITDRWIVSRSLSDYELCADSKKVA